MIHIAAVQVVREAGSVIVEGGVGSVIIVHVILQVPVFIVSVSAVSCPIWDVIAWGGVDRSSVGRGGIDRSRRDIQERHRCVGWTVIVIEGADHSVAVHISSEVTDCEVCAVLAGNCRIREAISEFLRIHKCAVRIHELPLSGVVVIRTGDKPGCTAGAADFICGVLCDWHAGIGKCCASKCEDQHEDQCNRDEFFHFWFISFHEIDSINMCFLLITCAV